MSEDSKCPLCGTLASRDTLKSLNGYRYMCSDCGGRFEIGTGAQRRAERGELHPEIVTSVRDLIVAGKIPRIELDAAEGKFEVLPDVTKG
jgi:transposase-like protein